MEVKPPLHKPLFSEKNFSCVFILINDTFLIIIPHVKIVSRDWLTAGCQTIMSLVTPRAFFLMADVIVCHVITARANCTSTTNMVL